MIDRGLDHPVPRQKLEQQEGQQRNREHEIVEIRLLLFADGRQHNESGEDFEHVARECSQGHAAADGENEAEQVDNNRVETVHAVRAGKFPRPNERKYHQRQYEEARAQVNDVVNRIEGKHCAVQDDDCSID